jgi:cell division protein FtsI (penicillin-binding protein 3)
MKRANRVYKLTLYMYYCFIAFAIYCLYFAIATLTDKKLRQDEKIASQNIDKGENFRRGDILSCDGRTLVAYYPEYKLYADFNAGRKESFTIDERKVSSTEKGKKPAKSDNVKKLDTFRINVYKDFANSLSKTLGGTASDYYKELYNRRKKAEEEFYQGKTKGNTKDIVKQKIDIFQREKIFGSTYLKKYGRNKTGIYTTELGKRIYLFGENFAHSVTGIAPPKRENDKENHGIGIEYIYDEELKNGDNVISTIDSRMQDICEVTLRNAISEDKRFVGGTIILMEVATGDIKAIANSGKYDKRNYLNLNDIFNNATNATIEPGSTFKTVSLMLALETGKISLSEKFNIKTWREFTEENRPDSFWTVSRIIEASSNMGTGNMIDKAFDRNIEKFVDAIKKLKITDKIGNINETEPYINTKWGKESMLRISHGYQMKLAPIHILSFYNAIANDGVMVKPRLMRGIVRHNTGKVEMFKSEIINKAICSKATLDTVRMVLSRVVGKGSAQQIAGRKYGISGKTGTAMIHLGNKSYYTDNGLSCELSSFCGYFPEKTPKYSCIVVLYSNYLTQDKRKSFFAGSTSVPVFGKIADRIYALYLEKNFTPAGNTANIPVVKSTKGENLSIISKKLNLDIPVENEDWVKVETIDNKLQTSEITVKNGIIPDVTGMGLRDAIFLLENKGLRVSHSGIGTIVKQSPEKGASYNSGQRIYLVLGNNPTNE